LRIGRVIGNLVAHRKLDELHGARFLIVDILDAAALRALPKVQHREKPMPETLVVYDQLGAGEGELIAVSEGREATAPFYPDNVPVDAYCAAILDTISMRPTAKE